MIDNGLDHLFRHQYGKMVSILTRIFGLSHLELIEDAIQDTFIKALQAWKVHPPENPEAWLMQAAKNRTLDLLRKLSAEQQRALKLYSGPAAIAINDLFLDTEIVDSQLRMIFTACHPGLHPREQIAFALKTLSGFSTAEIARALLLKEETVKKRLSRARKAILQRGVNFEIPTGHDLPDRLQMVLKVIYLMFNEGFHSGGKDEIVREELCGEAMRLCRMLMENEYTKKDVVYALFALFCFNSARLKSKVGVENEIISLKEQDRSLWDFELFKLGNMAMHKAVGAAEYSSYHYEAAIAFEHLKARSFSETNWHRIIRWYGCLQQEQPSPLNILNMAMAELERGETARCEELMNEIEVEALEQRAYLYYGLKAELYTRTNRVKKAKEQLSMAIHKVQNHAEKQFLKQKKALLTIMSEKG
jgi:RNA polymerase sigma-70 factor (ECF subfamily)